MNIFLPAAGCSETRLWYDFSTYQNSCKQLHYHLLLHSWDSSAVIWRIADCNSIYPAAKSHYVCRIDLYVHQQLELNWILSADKAIIDNQSFDTWASSTDRVDIGKPSHRMSHSRETKLSASEHRRSFPAFPSVGKTVDCARLSWEMESNFHNCSCLQLCRKKAVLVQLLSCDSVVLSCWRLIVQEKTTARLM